MANPVELQDLRARALDLADMTGSSFPVTARVDDYINDALSELHDILVDSYQDYLVSETDITLVSGTGAYSLPSNFYKSLEVFWETGGRLYPIPRYERKELGGVNLNPTRSGTVKMFFVPQFEKLTADDDTVHVSVPIRWEGFVSTYAAIELLKREESDPTLLMADLDRFRLRFIQMASPRDDGNPGRVADAYGRWEPSYSFGRDENVLRYRIERDVIRFVELLYQGS